MTGKVITGARRHGLDPAGSPSVSIDNDLKGKGGDENAL